MKHFILGSFWVCILLMGCATSIPVTDNTAPTFSIRIYGGGFDHTFTDLEELNRIQLDLTAEQMYTLIYIARDDGGIGEAAFSFSTDRFRIIPDPAAADWSTRVIGLSTYHEWSGDRSNPKNGILYSAKFWLEGTNINNNFRFLAADFGGSSGTPNDVRPDLYVFHVAGDAQIRER